MSVTTESIARSWKPRSSLRGSKKIDSAISSGNSAYTAQRPSARTKPSAPPSLRRVTRRPRISLPRVKPLAPTSQIITRWYAAGSAVPTPMRIIEVVLALCEVMIRMKPIRNGTVTSVAITVSISAARKRLTGVAGAQPSSGGSKDAAAGAPSGAAPGAVPGAAPGPGADAPGPPGMPGLCPGWFIAGWFIGGCVTITRSYCSSLRSAVAPGWGGRRESAVMSSIPSSSWSDRSCPCSARARGLGGADQAPGASVARFS